MNFWFTKSLPRRSRAFTLIELMIALVIFALIAVAGTYLLLASCDTQQYVQNSAAADSEVEFARQRITENIRAATAVVISGSTITITSPPSSLISGGTFTITYSILGSTLTETYLNNTNNQTYTSGTLVHNVTQFSVSKLAANPKAFQLVLTAGTTPSVQRTFVAFARNL